MGEVKDQSLQDAAALPPRVAVLLESALELMGNPVGVGELVLQVEDDRIRRWSYRSGPHGRNALERFDENRLEPAP